MKHHVVYEVENEIGKKYSKWIPSIEYELIAKNLLLEMKGGRKKIDWFGIPFILTLNSALEASLNDMLIIDTISKHGENNYKELAEAYIHIPLRLKLRVAVTIMTDNSFQLKEGNWVIKTLDEMISVRNKITHPKALFKETDENSRAGPKMHEVWDHPIQRLNLSKCRLYYRALLKFDKLFFAQYDKGLVKGNEILREVEQIGHQHQ